jgi:hypothetical protein
MTPCWAAGSASGFILAVLAVVGVIVAVLFWIS